MNKQQAEQFVNNVLNHLVNEADVESLSQFYHADVIGHYGDTNITFSDIENRARYLQAVFKHRRHILHEVIIADDKIIARDRQIMTHKKTNTVLTSEITGVYSIRDNKVAELWLMTDKVFDYRETPDHGLNNALPLQNDKAAIAYFRGVISNERYLVHDKWQAVELTERELETLFYTMQGLTAKQIGKRLDLSFRTIESYLETLKEKFDCESKVALRRKVTPGAVWF